MVHDRIGLPIDAYQAQLQAIREVWAQIVLEAIETTRASVIRVQEATPACGRRPATRRPPPAASAGSRRCCARPPTRSTCWP